MMKGKQILFYKIKEKSFIILIFLFRFYIRDLGVVVSIIEILIGRLYTDFSSFRATLESLLVLCSKVCIHIPLRIKILNIVCMFLL